MIGNSIRRIDHWVSSFTYKNVLSLKSECGVVSFSFDDAPKSACDEGRIILEKYGCRGTWYIAGGLTDKIDQGHLCHSESDVLDLFENGHQIGCHTFSHRACDSISEHELKLEIQRNSDYFNNIGLASSRRHFSFPFGAYDLASKKIASQYFLSSRITGGRFHVDYADLNALNAQRLYQGLITLEKLAELMKSVSEKKGWLILYTHDVTPNPSEWGCTANLLDYAIQAALAAGCKVMPIDRAIDYFGTEKNSFSHLTLS